MSLAQSRGKIENGRKSKIFSGDMLLSHAMKPLVGPANSESPGAYIQQITILFHQPLKKGFSFFFFLFFRNFCLENSEMF